MTLFLGGLLANSKNLVQKFFYGREKTHSQITDLERETNKKI